jgi:hypothetical protein
MKGRAYSLDLHGSVMITLHRHGHPMPGNEEEAPGLVDGNWLSTRTLWSSSEEQLAVGDPRCVVAGACTMSHEVEWFVVLVPC